MPLLLSLPPTLRSLRHPERPDRLCILLIFAWITGTSLCPAQGLQSTAANPTPAAGVEGLLREVPFSALSSPYVTPLGTAALSIRPTEWKHAETDNFIYHFFQGFVVAPVSVEAEFYYRIIAHDLSKDTSRWERKAHIFVFERPEDWKQFQTRGHLEPWTGGIHHKNELFILRDSAYRFKDWSLGHEIAHLVVNRFFGSENVPLWLNEGYAEYISRVAFGSFHRARGADLRPLGRSLPPGGFLPVAELANIVAYPTDVVKVSAFYTESEKLVRFLSATDKIAFLQLLDSLAKGSLFENALHSAYGTRFPSPHLLDVAFEPVATQQMAGAGPVSTR